jgi:multicomponent Na+:H+ antiporter subunit A
LGEPAVILDVTVQAVFHVALLFSMYLHFRGHNAPGGGFIAGLVASGALVLRLITGRPRMLQSRINGANNVLLGGGMVLVTGTVLVPLVLGNAPLEHHAWEYEVALLGQVKWTSALIFDTGVYLVVVGTVGTLLSVFGAEGEREQLEAAEEVAT